MMDKKFDIKYILRIAGVLLVICAVCAALLGTVNHLTKDKIAANTQTLMNESIALIFGDGISTEEITDRDFDGTVKHVFFVRDSGGNVLGYAVNAVPTGFKGDIEMMVGVTPAGKCKSVEIISMSETPGVGTKVGERAFLDQYHNAHAELVLKENIDAVSGATKSSRAVNLAVYESLNTVGGIINETES